ncbi:protein-glutamine gamma-glutamyltransferase 2 isoform X2 [Onychostoma macrolepis]|uniref:protein-glutamine gamma-glutamyltransferase 2 isoform X2 n=1 Tax=Onychostoma macrolepis TaxID=369639 RepID=UPI00272C13CE|nr:protein-glutamine gamma-glutamyltransferase 2 isoform X2 [Onychostoma macrolepis]
MSEYLRSKNSASQDQAAMNVDLQCVKNNTEHHTNEITEERLIVRRGQAFSLILSAERLDHNDIEITAATGPGACEQKGTLSSCSTVTQRCSSIGKRWSVRVLNSSPSAVTLSVLCPSDACIGLYSLSVRSGSCSNVNTLTVLFNPWCRDDWVFLPSEAERQEFVMNEQGIVYKGVDEYITNISWDFGQFEEDILDICLKLLDVNPKCLKDAPEDYSARCNPIYVSRVVSAMINSDDDKGVLMGQWDGTFIGGTLPSNWSSSVDILRQWIKYDCHPVKFGQCWVFAAVMCTVLRCLGIPCRVVTNFESAHDTDHNLVVDEYFGDYGVRPKRNKDSVWNYHVWVEGWMKRPDLSQDSFYDGWQVLDPTPQERNSGTYCCGPAPVKAVLEGHTDVKYEVPFVFGEVNADKITWLVMANGSKQKILSDTKTVGQKISTKAVGSDSRQDITDQYKHPEGSAKERAVYSEAVKRVTGLKESQTPLRPNIQMKVSLDGAPLNGGDISLKLLLKSDSSKAQLLTLKMSAQVMRYTGNPAADVWSHTADLQLQPNTEQTLPFTLPFTAYGPKLLDNNCIKVSVIGTDKSDPNAVYLAEKDVVPHSPTLSVTVSGTPLQDSEMTAEVIFLNPLPLPLRNCSIMLTGSGLLKQTEQSNTVELGPGKRITLRVTFKPYKVGPKKLVANFNSCTFKDIKASVDINVRPATLRLGFLSFSR